MDAAQFTQNHKNEYFNNYMKYLTKQFMGCFGKTKHMQKFNISYIFAGKHIKFFLNRDGYVRFSLDVKLKEELLRLINEASEMFLNNFNTNGLLDNITAVGIMKRHLNERLLLAFENNDEIIYIPAGRSLLATMSEQLQDVSTDEMDLPMQEFIKLIKITKNKFGTEIPEMITDYVKSLSICPFSMAAIRIRLL